MSLIIKLKDEEITIDFIHDLQDSNFIKEPLVRLENETPGPEFNIREFEYPIIPLPEPLLIFNKQIDTILSSHLDTDNENESYRGWERDYLQVTINGELKSDNEEDIVIDLEQKNENQVNIPASDNVKIRFTTFYESNRTKSGISQKTSVKRGSEIGADIRLRITLDLDSAKKHLKNVIENEAKRGQQVFLSALRELPKSSFIRYLNDLGMLQIAKTLSKEYDHEVFSKKDAKTILHEMDIFLGRTPYSCEPLNAQGRLNLPKVGTELYCPNCDAIVACHDTSETNESTIKNRNYYNEEHPTVNWHRRARMCSECGHEFLTGEIHELLIDELVTLKQAQHEPQRLLDDNLSHDDDSWLHHDTSNRIPYAWAYEFIARTAWWLHHPSGAVRAPKHANRIFESKRHGWAIEFGANSFLVETAIKRSIDAVKNLLDTNGAEREELKSEIRRHISGAVSNHYDEEYSGYYPLEGNDMVFGSTSIDVEDAVEFILEKTLI